MTVFSRGVPLNQVLFTSYIDICLQVLQVGTRGHLFTSTRYHLFTSTRCHLFTRVYNILQVHVSPRSEVTFGNDVALRKTLRKKQIKSNITYY